MMYDRLTWLQEMNSHPGAFREHKLDFNRPSKEIKIEGVNSEV